MVAKAKSTLEQHQTILHNDRDNTHILTCDKHFRVDIVNLKFAKKMLYA
jgi:stress-induced morphogen